MTGNRSEMVERAEGEFTKGDTFLEDGDDHWQSGIDAPNHAQIIVCYGANETKATALRDKVLKALAAPNQPLSDSVVEPVAWRWRYVRENGKPDKWTVCQTPRYSQPATPGFVAIEAEPLYAAAIPSAGGVETQESLREARHSLQDARTTLVKMAVGSIGRKVSVTLPGAAFQSVVRNIDNARAALGGGQ